MRLGLTLINHRSQRITLLGLLLSLALGLTLCPSARAEAGSLSILSARPIAGARSLNGALAQLKSSLRMGAIGERDHGFEKALFRIILYLASAIFFVVQMAPLYSRFRSRRFESNSENRPRAWEAVWSAIPAVILLALILAL